MELGFFFFHVHVVSVTDMVGFQLSGGAGTRAAPWPVARAQPGQTAAH